MKSTLNIHWKDWCWNSNTLASWCKESTNWKRPWCWEILRAGEGLTEYEMVGWHHRLNGHKFEQTLGDGEGQGSLACYSSWGSQRVRCDLANELNWNVFSKHQKFFILMKFYLLFLTQKCFWHGIWWNFPISRPWRLSPTFCFRRF